MFPMLKYLRLICTVGIRILWDFAFYISRYARHPEKYPLEKRYAKIHQIAKYIIKGFRPDFQFKGLEELRKLEESGRPFLLVSNHESDMDPILMLALSEKPISFVAKKETLKFPFIGKAIKSIDGFFMDRNDMRQSLRVMIDLGKRFEKGDLSYVIYPEGTRNKELDKSLLLPYKPGAVKSAKKAGVKILPICIYGNFRILPMNTNFKRMPLEVTFFEPFDEEYVKNNDTETITNKIYELTLEEIKKQKIEDEKFFEKGYQKIPLRKGSLR